MALNMVVSEDALVDSPAMNDLHATCFQLEVVSRPEQLER